MEFILDLSALLSDRGNLFILWRWYTYKALQSERQRQHTHEHTGDTNYLKTELGLGTTGFCGFLERCI